MSKAKSILRTYIEHIRKRAPYGVPETSHYGAMEELFDSVGKTLDPGVFCVTNPSSTGAGIPDGGLFTEDQQGAEMSPHGFNVKPARGVVEAKPLDENVYEIAERRQVQDYLAAYGQVLVTNFYQFLLVRRGDDGRAVPAEFYSLARDADGFLTLPETQITDVHADDLFTFLQLVMLSDAPIVRPLDVAHVLAFYARESKHRIERGDVDLSTLESIRADLESALGIKFEGKDGERFFVSTLVQTLFYGVFSAWALWSASPNSMKTHARFDWRLSQYLLRIPVIQALIAELTKHSRLKRLGLIPVLDWAGAALNRVNRVEFFQVFQAGQAVQYFYEPFLEAFDPQLRKDLGVWYTPPEIVQYMVERVDRVLREELHIEDGLADESVYVLDPACGTGAYLAAVLEHIYRTKSRYYGEEQAAGAVRAAIRNVVGQEPAGRVYGFEILPAPFVVAHLQLGLLLERLGAPLEGREERVGVYLTNALVGWEPGGEMSIRMRQLEQENIDAAHIKQGRKILVVVGNPPYNAFAGTSTPAERIAETEGLVDRYKWGLRETWGVKKYNLDDLYIRFFRIAERCIAEFRSEGVVCYISNFSYLDGDSFVVMREHFLSEFDRIWIDNLNGDSRETGKRTPLGKPDPSVFSTDLNRAGIRKGAAICVMVRRSGTARAENAVVQSRAFWGSAKRQELVDSLSNPTTPPGTESQYEYEVINPTPSNRYCFRPMSVSAEYRTWPLVAEMCAEGPFNGPIERRGNSLIVYEHEQKELLEKLKAYLDSGQVDENIGVIEPRFMRSSGEFVAEKARKLLLQRGVQTSPDKIVRYPFKPFDVRFAYLDARLQPLFSRPSPALLELRSIPGNAFFVTRDHADKPDEGVPLIFSNLVCDYHLLSGEARHFPILVKRMTAQERNAGIQPELFDREGVQSTLRANLSRKTRDYLATLGMTDPDADPEAAAVVWMHALAIGYSPQYLEQNEDGVRSDWPRIPLPDNPGLLRRSAALGKQIAALLNTEENVLHVTSGHIREELRLLGVQQGHHLAVTARWGYLDPRGAVMPGLGDAREREYTPSELAGIEEGAKELSLELDDALRLLGDTTFDVHLNDEVCWSNVPGNVYGYTIGGYQVIKKWLSYRNEDVIGRPLTDAESLQVTHIIRRIAAIVLLQPHLNANYLMIASKAYGWPTG